jgi:hypothetical protein
MGSMVALPLSSRQFHPPRREGAKHSRQTSLPGLAGLTPPGIGQPATMNRHEWSRIALNHRNVLFSASIEVTPAI